MAVILVEGPDRCGKTTFAQQLAKATGAQFKFLPSPTIRPLIFDGELNNTFLFFADAYKFWITDANWQQSIVLDRDILSMIAYQGFLLKQMDPLDIIDLFKKYIYRYHQPQKIYYITNEPFADYDQNCPFEKHGYEAIRTCFEAAVDLVAKYLPNLIIERLEIEADGVH